MGRDRTVILDSCVLYPAPLRDLLLSLAVADLYRPRWSECIQQEWTRAVRENRPDVAPDRIERTLRLMSEAVPDAQVTEYEDLIETIQLPDANDRHVLAAAIRAEAGIILTYNVKHFPESLLEAFNVRATHPDEFIVNLIELDSQATCWAMKEHRSRLKNPSFSAREYVEVLRRQRLAQTATRLLPLVDYI